LSQTEFINYFSANKLCAPKNEIWNLPYIWSPHIVVPVLLPFGTVKPLDEQLVFAALRETPKTEWRESWKCRVYISLENSFFLE